MDAYSEGDFVVFRDRPIFKQSIGPAEDDYPDGFRYTREILKSMVKTMNYRIQNSDDWCPLVAHHRPKEHEKPYKEEPELCGFVGPFRLGMFGKVDPVWCIFGDQWVFKDKEDYVRKHPRLSVELHPESDPHERFFDPIACLGAETPGQDLGLHYSRTDLTHHFSAPAAAFPSATSTFVPTLGKKPQQHAKDSDMDTSAAVESATNPQADGMSPELTRQITDLVKSLVGNGNAFSQIQLQQLGQMIQSITEAVVEEKLAGPNDDEPTDLDGDGDPDALETETPSEETPPTDADNPEETPEPAADDDEEEPVIDEDKKKPAQQYAKICQYAMDGDVDGAAQMYAKMDKDSQGACAQHFDQEGNADLKTKLKPIFEDTRMSDVKPNDKAAQQYAKDRQELVQQFQKQNDELKKDRDTLRAEVQQYAKELAEVKEDLTRQRSEKARAICYSRAEHLADQGYILDVGSVDDAEPTDDMKHILSLTDEQRTHYFEHTIPQHFQKVPTQSLPRERTSLAPLAGEAEERKMLQKASQYADSHPGVPFDECLAAVATAK